MTSNSALRTRWAAVGAAVAITVGAVGLGGLNIASAGVSEGDRPVFIPINPCRLLDTRPGVANVGPRTGPVGAGETHTVTAHGDNGDCTGASTIPTDALSLSLNVTAVGATASTFLTFWGDGANPGTSNLNPRPGAAPTPNSVNTPLSAAGTFNIYNDAGEVNVIADVNGYYAHHDHDDRYYTKEEIDLARPTEIHIAPAAFETYDSSMVPNRPFGITVTPAGECAVAPIPLDTNMTIEGAAATLQTENPGLAEVFLFGVLNESGTGLELDDILTLNTGPTPTPLAVTTSGVDTELHTAAWVPDDIILDPDRFTYQVIACPDLAGGPLSVLGATVTVSYP